MCIWTWGDWIFWSGKAVGLLRESCKRLKNVPVRKKTWSRINNSERNISCSLLNHNYNIWAISAFKNNVLIRLVIRRNVSGAEGEVLTWFLCRQFQHRWSLSLQTERSNSNLSLVWAVRSEKWAACTERFPSLLPLVKCKNVCSFWIIGGVI